MTQAFSNSQLADQGAKAIRNVFNTYHTRFKEITKRARSRFLDRDWQAMRTDATQRLELYRKAVDRIETGIRQLLAGRVQDIQIWADLKAAYTAMPVRNNDWELA